MHVKRPNGSTLPEAPSVASQTERAIEGTRAFRLGGEDSCRRIWIRSVMVERVELIRLRGEAGRPRGAWQDVGARTASGEGRALSERGAQDPAGAAQYGHAAGMGEWLDMGAVVASLGRGPWGCRRQACQAQDSTAVVTYWLRSHPNRIAVSEATGAAAAVEDPLERSAACWIWITDEMSTIAQAPARFPALSALAHISSPSSPFRPLSFAPPVTPPPFSPLHPLPASVCVALLALSSFVFLPRRITGSFPHDPVNRFQDAVTNPHGHNDPQLPLNARPTPG